MTTFPIDENINKRKTLTRADFRPEELRRLIIQKGLRCEWTQASQCPCSQKSTEYGLDLRDVTDIDSNPGLNNQSCPVCKGNGFIYHSPQEIKAITTGVRTDTEVAEYGLNRTGDVKFTVQPEHLLSYGDRIKLKDSVIVYREVLTKTASNTVSLKFPIVQRTLDIVGGPLTIGVTYCHIADSNGLTLVNGERIQGTHFTVDVSGRLVWNGDVNTPAVGTKYTVNYYAHPTYVIIDYPHTVRDTFNMFKTNGLEVPTPLPVQAVAKLITE